MKFRFTKSGGFASLKYILNDDSENLSSGNRKVLESLASPSPDFKLKPANKLAKDILKYHLEIDKEKTFVYDFDELTMPSRLASLVDELSGKSTPAYN